MRTADDSQRHGHRRRAPLGDLRKRWGWLLLGGLAALLALGAISMPVMAYTARPTFCKTCHEMTPYYAAFAVGPHKGVQCVDCHVDPGIVAEMSHKVVALKEVADHFTSKPLFPQPDVSVPDSRCIQCHKDLPVTAKGFAHSAHTGALACQKCHPDVGHHVTPAALAEAGILNPAAPASAGNPAVVVASASLVPTATALADPARFAGHKNVACIGCHQLSTWACSKCHTAPHPARGECVLCHRADPSPKPFAFVHPDSTECSTCHTAPHVARGTCTDCHKSPGVSWKFTHPARTDCASCHKPPVTHTGARTTGCDACHRQRGVSWAFTHPARLDCATCHTAPANHFGTECSSCHSPETPFKSTRVDHAQATSACQTCHTPPTSHSGVRASGCTACHKSAGVSWAFTHPARTDCAACHTAPAAHYGATCSSCHRPGLAFASTRVDHRAIAAACQTCHTPPAAHTGQRKTACASCHRSAGVKWTFTHPKRTDCGACHSAPGNHTATAAAASSARLAVAGTTSSTVAIPGARIGQCAACHRSAGVSWKFTHPARTDCSTCHAAPAAHYGTACAACHSPGVAFEDARVDHSAIASGCQSCHTPAPSHTGIRTTGCEACHRSAGVSWAFTHPARTDCASCHTPPATHTGQRTARCGDCHRTPGVSWAFTHPARTDCASCHTPPEQHYATDCASCHSPTVAFASTTFTHPDTGGPHTSRTFPCSLCHPSGYATHDCTSCHGPAQ